MLMWVHYRVDWAADGRNRLQAGAVSGAPIDVCKPQFDLPLLVSPPPTKPGQLSADAVISTPSGRREQPPAGGGGGVPARLKVTLVRIPAQIHFKQRDYYGGHSCTS